MRNPTKGAWTRRYRILDIHPDLRVATQLMASDSPEGQPDAMNGLLDVTNGLTDVTQLVARSSTKGSVPKEAVERFEIWKEPNPNGKTKTTPKKEITEFYFKGKYYPYKSKGLG